MCLSLDKQYRVIEVTFYNVVATVLKEYYESFDNQDFINMTCIKLLNDHTQYHPMGQD